MAHILSATERDRDEWNSFIEKAPDGCSPYHVYEWRSVISSCYKLESDYLLCRDDSGSICNVLPLFYLNQGIKRVGVSLPYAPFGGEAKLREVDNDRLKAHIVNIIEDRQLAYVELRSLCASLEDSDLNPVLVTQRITLDRTEEQVWKGLNGVCRRAVRRALKSGLQIQCGREELVNLFSSIYQQRMLTLGTPAHGVHFFRKVLSSLGDQATILMVFANEIPIAGMLAIHGAGIAHNAWAGYLAAYSNSSPNDLLYWEALRWAVKQGCSEFDFGRSRPGSGVYRFKKKWSSYNAGLCYTRVMKGGEMKIIDQAPYHKLTLASKVWKRLPDKVAQKLGPIARKHLP